MLKKVRLLMFAVVLMGTFFLISYAVAAPAPNVPGRPDFVDKGMSLWELVVSGGVCMIFLTLVSIIAVALIVYNFMYVTSEKLIPRDFSETLLALLEKRETQKAISLCKQQENMISGIALEGLTRLPKGISVAEEAIQYEGKARIEKLWEKLSYLGDSAVVAPMLGLLGTILGMIQAFNYQAFKAGIIKPVILAQGLSKAMITTAYGLMIAVPVLVFYSYFRGRIIRITSDAERIMSEMLQLLKRS